MTQINSEWQIVSYVFFLSVAVRFFPFALGVNKEKWQKKTRNTKRLREGGWWDFAPVSFRVMMFEIFFAYLQASVLLVSSHVKIYSNISVHTVPLSNVTKNQWLYIRNNDRRLRSSREQTFLPPKMIVFTLRPLNPWRPVFRCM